MVASKDRANRAELEPKCPACKRILTDPADYAHAKQEFEKSLSLAHLEMSRKEKKEFASTLQELRSKHKIEMQKSKTNYRQHEAELRKRLNGQLKNEKKGYKQKMEAIRRDNQAYVQQTRETYETQNLIAQKDREGLFNNQLREILQNYANLSANYQKELERLRKIQDDSGAMIRKIEGEIARIKIGLVKSTSDPQVARLLVQLGERDATIDDLRTRITELESKLLAATTVDRPVATKQPVMSQTPVQAHFEHETTSSGPENGEKINEFQANSLSEDVDPRESFINAIKEINRNVKRTRENPVDNNSMADASVGSGETIISNENKDGVNGTKTTKFRKWFA